ncbi:hypothetical protein [Nocardioides nanhaiensis]|uniref:CARDB domain-containing protein n=1 Tax=Nocardioides nanhaiensis TaxID=1476871 RepID=A0ABP8VPI8_9ACTN
MTCLALGLGLAPAGATTPAGRSDDGAVAPGGERSEAGALRVVVLDDPLYLNRRARVRVQVTNLGESTVRSVELLARGPRIAQLRTAPIDALEPGETTQTAIVLRAGGDAVDRRMTGARTYLRVTAVAFDGSDASGSRTRGIALRVPGVVAPGRFAGTGPRVSLVVREGQVRRFRMRLPGECFSGPGGVQYLDMRLPATDINRYGWVDRTIVDPDGGWRTDVVTSVAMRLQRDRIIEGSFEYDQGNCRGTTGFTLRRVR